MPNAKEIDDLINKLDINVTTKGKNIVDKRMCTFCQAAGDLDTNGPGRLLLMDVGQWCHLNCALWSTEVFERMNGALMNVDVAFKRSLNNECFSCKRKGASLQCFSQKCGCFYHLPCAIKEKCIFYQDKTIYCLGHAPKISNENILTDLSVFRKVWIERNEVSQIQR